MRDDARVWARPVLGTLAMVLVFAAVLFGGYGSFEWPMGWGVIAGYALYSLVGIVLLPREVVEERGRMPADAERRDLALAGLTLLFLFPVTFFVCGLDRRLGWSPELSPALRAAACGVVVLGYGVSLHAARTNRFFSAVVSIQRERGHHVVDTGPYAVVRHPGYAGPLLAHPALPLALGSVLGVLPALVGCAFLVLRALHEEQRLARELAGYAEYMQRVPYRIVPRVW